MSFSVLGPTVDVSNLPGAQSETGIAINPLNPRNLVVVSNDNPGRLATYCSFNAGASWSTTFINNKQDGLQADARFDPNVVFDSKGNVYVVYSIRTATGATQSRIMLARSTDGGKTYTVAPVASDAENDKLHTAAVTTRKTPGPKPDGVLVVWSREAVGGERIQAALSLDGGAHFQHTNIPINDSLQATFFPWAAADAAGNFHVIWEVNNLPDQAKPRGAIFHRILKADNTLGPVTQVTTLQMYDDPQKTIRPPAQPDNGIFSVGTIDVDRSGGPFSGRIYVSYTDRPNPNMHRDDTNIFVRYSKDGGSSWSAPIQINDDTTNTSQFLPRLAVDQTSGTVVATWYDARNDPTNQKVNLFAADSKTGGVTWCRNQPVTEQPSDESSGNVFRDTSNNFGDYLGLAVYGGVAYPAWTDARAANFPKLAEEIYSVGLKLLP